MTLALIECEREKRLVKEEIWVGSICICVGWVVMRGVAAWLNWRQDVEARIIEWEKWALTMIFQAL